MSKHRIPEAERYRGPVKWIQYICARVLILGLVHLPIGLAYRLGRGVGWLCSKLLRTRRAVVRKNLEVVNAWMELNKTGTLSYANMLAAGDLDAQVEEVFMRSGANLLSGFTFSQLTLSQVEKHLEIVGLEYLEAALSANRGAIILLAHMGPWEALTQLPTLAVEFGIHSPLAALYRPLNNRYLDDWYKTRRESSGTHLFSRRDGFNRPVDFLRGGGIVGILADQKMRQGELAEFFNCECKTNPLPGLLQRRSGSGAVSLSMQTVGKAKWTLTFESVDFTSIEGERTRQNEARITNVCLENILSTSPLDVFWFQSRF
jgi:lauroyl/myristoyl acyltransferase